MYNKSQMSISGRGFISYKIYSSQSVICYTQKLGNVLYVP
jgi:hypothetical protein